MNEKHKVDKILITYHATINNNPTNCHSGEEPNHEEYGDVFLSPCDYLLNDMHDHKDKYHEWYCSLLKKNVDGMKKHDECLKHVKKTTDGILSYNKG